MSDDIQSLILFVLDEGKHFWTMDPVRNHKPEGRISVDLANQRAKEAVKFELSPLEAAQIIAFQMQRQNAKLGGSCIHHNSGFAFASPLLQTDVFILGDFMVIDNRNDDLPRFDERMALKEDYDYSASHLAKFGVVCRVNQILITAEHRVNTGGAVFYRSRSLELAHIQFLKAKWPGVFRENIGRQGPMFVLDDYRHMPIKMEKKPEGYIVSEVSFTGEREDSLKNILKGMRLMKINNEALRKDNHGINIEELLYGRETKTGSRSNPMRPLQLVFGFTTACPPTEVLMHWDRRDESLGGTKTVEKVPFPPTDALQKVVRQHRAGRQPGILELFLRSAPTEAPPEPAVTPPPAKRAKLTENKWENLKSLLERRPSLPAGTTTTIRDRLTRANMLRHRKQGEDEDHVVHVPDFDLLEHAVDLVMSGHSYGEVIELLPITEAELVSYIEGMEKEQK